MVICEIIRVQRCFCRANSRHVESLMSAPDNSTTEKVVDRNCGNSMILSHSSTFKEERSGSCATLCYASPASSVQCDTFNDRSDLRFERGTISVDTEEYETSRNCGA